MAVVERAQPADKAAVERLLAAYHASEGLTPRPARIAWAIEEQLRRRFPGILLVARDAKGIVGVALAVYQPSAELGRTLVVQDFFVEPAVRRTGVGRALAAHLLKEAKAMGIERVDLEVLPSNAAAVAFWKALGFRATGRAVFGLDVR